MRSLKSHLLEFLLTVSVTLAVIGLAVNPQLVARALPFTGTRITGTIYGASATTPKPLAGASIACGSARATTDGRGHFTLVLLKGRAYTCEVSARLYTTMRVTLSTRMGDVFQLDLGPAQTGVVVGAQANTGCQIAPTREVCPALALVGGDISGQVTQASDYAPIAKATVICWDDSAATQVSATPPARYSATTDTQGRYALHNAPPGAYLCVANQQGAPQHVVVTAAATSPLNFVECGAHCGGVTYHTGPVMHTFTAYVIFWAPSGVNFEPGGQNGRFQSLLRQYLTDVGGTRFFGLLTQYWDTTGPVRNVATLGGVYVDHEPYPHAGTRSNPLSDDDITSEIIRVRGLEGWKVTSSSAFIMVAGYNVQECAKFSDGQACSYPDSAGNGFCAYHSYTPYYSDQAGSPDYMPYIVLANNHDCGYLPTFDSGAAPYGDQTADAVINSLSHEQFETITDPETLGWYDATPSGGEIADKCETSFGNVNGDGATVILNHGHGYALQEEYSDRAGDCAYQ